VKSLERVAGFDMIIFPSGTVRPQRSAADRG
jgi:hypothetical protein